MNKLVLLTEGNNDLTFDLKPESNNNITLVDLTQSNVDLNLNINFAYKSKCMLQLTSLNVENFTKNYKLNMNHNTNEGISNTSVYAVNQDSSKTYAQIFSVVKRNTDLNETYQNIRAINLDEKSSFKGEPMLRVDNNNIKAKHEMTVGQLDKNILFYLMSRGLSKKQAQKLVIEGHFIKIIHRLKQEQQQEFLTYLEKRLSKYDIN